jgi:ATP-binding protein involved in chromosome partitioning
LTTAPPASAPSAEQLTAALSTVIDPEIRRPVTELGMVKSASVDADGTARVGIFLTVSGCPMKDTITERVTTAVGALPGVTRVLVELDVMSGEQRQALQTLLRGDDPVREIPFALPGSLTKVFAVASGKGGVGKSSVTVNLAAAMAQQGLSVGVLDADIYGFSVPRMLGVTHRPTQVESMIMPPSAHGVKVISIGMFTKDNTPVVWRGPMLHRALQQFLSDVYWGDLDVLLMDLPPGTGDVAISVAQLVPSAEILVVTTPQLAAQEVAERAGSIALQTHQRIAGVVENMSYLECPHCDEAIDGLRLRRRAGGGQLAVPAARCAGAAARSDPDRRAAARGRRQRPAARAVRPVGDGVQGAAGGHPLAGRQAARPGRHVARAVPRTPLTPACRQVVSRQVVSGSQGAGSS